MGKERIKMNDEDYKGYRISIEQSEYEESPLEWTTPEERGAWFVMKSNFYTLPNDLNVDFDEYDGWLELVKANIKKGQVYKFIDWYEHSGIVVRLVDGPKPLDRWDSGIVGLIIANSEQELLSSFTEWKAYVEGDIWDYSIYNDDGETVDSLCSIYGYEYALKESKQFIDSYIPPRKLAKSAQELHRGIV